MYDRLTSLYVFNDLTSCSVYDSVSKIMSMYHERNDCVPEPLLRESVKFHYYDNVWRLAVTKRQHESGAAPSEQHAAQIAHLRKRVTR